MSVIVSTAGGVRYWTKVPCLTLFLFLNNPDGLFSAHASANRARNPGTSNESCEQQVSAPHSPG